MTSKEKCVAYWVHINITSRMPAQIIFQIQNHFHKEAEYSEAKVTWNYHHVCQRRPIIYISKCSAFPRVWIRWHHTEVVNNQKSSHCCSLGLPWPAEHAYPCKFVTAMEQALCCLFSAVVSAEFYVYRAFSKFTPSFFSFSFCLWCGPSEVMRCFPTAWENAYYRTTDVVWPLLWARITHLM